MSQTLSDLQTLSDIAVRLQVSVRTVYRLEDFPAPIRLGRLVRWRAEDVEAWVTARACAPKKRLGRPRGTRKRPASPRATRKGA